MDLHFLLFCTFVLSCHEVGIIKISKAARYHDTYDCVDFYKQPSLDHPMLKNNSFHPLMRPYYHIGSAKRNKAAKKNKSKIDGCPDGTVPIRRITQSASKISSFVSVISVNEPSGTYNAGVRTKPGLTRYSGGGMVVSVYNPRTKPGAYSQARIKISSGQDAIQVGWRVDPLLRGDNLTRVFIYTETSSSRCFDAHCGFVHVNKGFILDDYIAPISQPGGEIYEYKFYIIRDPSTGNWWLHCGILEDITVGFWPKDIFTGLRDLATHVDWAGEVYSPSGVFEPLMGSGYRPSVGTTEYVAYFRVMQVLNENNTYVDADNVEEYATDRSLYDVDDFGNRGGYFRHIVLFGGARY